MPPDRTPRQSETSNSQNTHMHTLYHFVFLYCLASVKIFCCTVLITLSLCLLQLLIYFVPFFLLFVFLFSDLYYCNDEVHGGSVLHLSNDQFLTIWLNWYFISLLKWELLSPEEWRFVLNWDQVQDITQIFRGLDQVKTKKPNTWKLVS